jgi:hypothetical protein
MLWIRAQVRGARVDRSSWCGRLDCVDSLRNWAPVGIAVGEDSEVTGPNITHGSLLWLSYTVMAGNQTDEHYRFYGCNSERWMDWGMNGAGCENGWVGLCAV